jgi:hypothetical protein
MKIGLKWKCFANMEGIISKATAEFRRNPKEVFAGGSNNGRIDEVNVCESVQESYRVRQKSLTIFKLK